MRLTAAMSVLFLLSACGPTSIKDAQTQGTRAACDWAASCGEIGPGADKDFEDRMECEVHYRDIFQAGWPEGTCMAINEKGLDTCLDRIRTTTCNSGLDFLTTLTICRGENVCTSK